MSFPLCPFHPISLRSLNTLQNNTTVPPHFTSQLPPESLPSVDSASASLRLFRASGLPSIPSRDHSSATRTDERILDPESLGIEKNILSFYQTMDAEEDDLASRLYDCSASASEQSTSNALHSQWAQGQGEAQGRLSSSQSDSGSVSASQLSCTSSSLNSNSWSNNLRALGSLPLPPPPVISDNGNGDRKK
jgi:hypothetical protein